MVTKKSSSRPFGQGDYDKNLLQPTFKDFQYKFVAFLPMSESTLGSNKKKQVFSKEDLGELGRLFNDDFGGFTLGRESPSSLGQWIDISKNVIVNEHARFEVFSQRTREALNYFDELKERLHIRAEKLGAIQDIILIEQSEVTFAIKPTFNKKFLELLLRRTNK
ncbi:MAG: hypothetical protein KGI06_03110 [Candidatus Micrarchaeota archaeon]|nr:hypothetical protein [Candidatus Micrarchaeota archaeon]